MCRISKIITFLESLRQAGWFDLFESDIQALLIFDPLITLWGNFDAPDLKLLNDASVASACFYVRTCRRVRNSKKIATIRDFHLPGSFLCLSTRLINLLRIFKTPKLKTLDFSFNQIVAIDEEDGKFLSNLTYLDLSNNRLVSLRNLLHLNQIEILYLNGNNISIIPKSLLSKSRFPLLQTLNLNKNDFLCNCSVVEFKQWLLTDKAINLENSLHMDYVYLCANPTSTLGLSVTEVVLECTSDNWKFVLKVVGIGAAVLITVFLIALFHWDIKNRLFLLCRCVRKKPAVNADIELEEMNDIPRYDAYVSYHAEDEDWVADELEFNIEGGEEPLELCIKNRDIPAGRPLLNSISLYMKQSRKILVVLSPNYLENNWCKFEFDMAYQQLVEEEENVIILILLKDIPENRVTLRLRRLFRQVQCLKWPADGCKRNLFWQCLRQEITR